VLEPCLILFLPLFTRLQVIKLKSPPSGFQLLPSGFLWVFFVQFVVVVEPVPSCYASLFKEFEVLSTPALMCRYHFTGWRFLLIPLFISFLSSLYLQQSSKRWAGVWSACPQSHMAEVNFDPSILDR